MNLFSRKKYVWQAVLIFHKGLLSLSLNPPSIECILNFAFMSTFYHSWDVSCHIVLGNSSLCKVRLWVPIWRHFIPKGKFAAESLHKNVYMTQHGCPHILVWPLGYTYLRNLFFIGENFVNKYEYLKEFWTSIGRLIKPSISNITFWGENNAFWLQLHLNGVACVCKSTLF